MCNACRNLESELQVNTQKIRDAGNAKALDAEGLEFLYKSFGLAQKYAAEAQDIDAVMIFLGAQAVLAHHNATLEPATGHETETK